MLEIFGSGMFVGLGITFFDRRNPFSRCRHPGTQGALIAHQQDGPVLLHLGFKQAVDEFIYGTGRLHETRKKMIRLICCS